MVTDHLGLGLALHRGRVACALYLTRVYRAANTVHDNGTMTTPPMRGKDTEDSDRHNRFEGKGDGPEGRVLEGR